MSTNHRRRILAKCTLSVPPVATTFTIRSDSSLPSVTGVGPHATHWTNGECASTKQCQYEHPFRKGIKIKCQMTANALFFRHRPVFKSHTRIVWSSAADSRNLPQGWKVSSCTQPSCPTCNMKTMSSGCWLKVEVER